MARILVVDDNYDMLMMLRMILEKRAKHEVILCQNGSEALEKAFAEQPDIGVIDVMMPGMSGYDVVKQLRSDPRTERMGIIILTARGQPVDKLAALEAGADDHIPKPVTLEDLLSHVDALLERQKEAVQAPSAVFLPVFSLKGGVGVTTLAVNLAYLLQQVGQTILVDLSPKSGHCALFLGLRPEKHWGQYLTHSDTPLASLMLQHPSGLQVLAAPTILRQQGWFGEDDINRLLEELKSLARFVVIDMPPVLDAATLALLAQANRILLVGGDDPPSIQSTLITLQALQEWKEHILLVRNASTAGPHLQAEAVQRALRAPLAADVPYDPTQAAALRKGIPLAAAQPNAPLANGLKRAAQIIVAQ